jgi:hypothetical protein
MGLDLSDAVEQRRVQPVVSYGAVVTLDVGVLLWLSRLYVFEFDIVLRCPRRQGCAVVFETIVTS